MACFNVLTAVVFFAFFCITTNSIATAKPTASFPDSTGDSNGLGLKRGIRSINNDQLTVQQKVAGLRDHIADIMNRGAEQELVDLMQRIAVEKTRRHRLERCIAKLGSRAICQHQVGFYIWAQLLAKDIMAGHAR